MDKTLLVLLGEAWKTDERADVLALVDRINRLLRLFGHGSLTSTTRAMDEGAQRVSSYLVVQVMINTGRGSVRPGAGGPRRAVCPLVGLPGGRAAVHSLHRHLAGRRVPGAD